MLSRALADEIRHVISGNRGLTRALHTGNTVGRRCINAAQKNHSICTSKPTPSSCKSLHQDATSKSMRSEVVVEGDTLTQTEPIWDVSFDNVQDAYLSKSNTELLRSLMVFKMCGINLIVDNSMLVSPFNSSCLHSYQLGRFDAKLVMFVVFANNDRKREKEKGERSIVES